MADGVITTAQRLAVQLKMQDYIGTSSPQIQHLMTEDFGTVKALRERQVPSRIDLLAGQDKDDSIDVHWIEKDETAAATGTTACDFTGPEAGSFKQTYTLSTVVEKNFSISEAKFRTSQFDPVDLLALQMLEADHKLCRDINTKAIAFLNNNLGTSAYTIPGVAADAGTGYAIPASMYTTALVPQIMLAAKRNKMANPFLIGGARAWTSDWLINTDSSDGSDGRKTRTSLMDTAFDIDGLIADTDDPTYLIDRMAYAIAIKNRNGAGIKDHQHEGRFSYTMQSQFLPGVTFDVFERKTCEQAGMDTTHYSIKARVGNFLNPVYSQAATLTGIFKLKVS